MGSHEVASKHYVSTENSQMVSIGATFTSMYCTSHLTLWPYSSASRVVNCNGLSACQGEREPFKDHQNTCGHLTQASGTSHSKSSLGNLQYLYVDKLLVNVYSYHLMEKSVSCCCVHGRWIFLDLVTKFNSSVAV